MAVWKVGLVLLPLCVGCQQLRLPTTPDPVAATTVEVAPLRVIDDTRPADAAAPAPAPAPAPPTPAQPRVTVPAWQQAVLSKIIAGLTDETLRADREIPGIVIRFEIEAARGGSAIIGELRNPRQPRSEHALHLHYLLLPGALSFPDKATLLSALDTAVTYKAEVRLRSSEITCCLDKPAIAVTGRFEAAF